MAYAPHPLPSVLADAGGMAAIVEGVFGGRYAHLGEPITVAEIVGLARQLGRLLGPAYPALDGSANAADLSAWGCALAAQRGMERIHLAEAFVDTASADTLGDWFRMLGLSSAGLSDDARRTLLLARWRTRFAGTPDAILRALTPLNGGVAPTMRETLARDSHANPPRVFAFTVYTSVDPNSAAIAPLTDVVAVMKPAHTREHFTDRSLTLGFFCDGFNDSVTDNTVLSV